MSGLNINTILLILVVSAIIEYKFGRDKYSVVTKDRFEDSAWLVANELLYPIVLGGVSFKLGLWLEGHLKGFGLVWDISGAATWVQFLGFIFLIDAVSFIFHYLIHKYNILWDFHKAHHSTTELTVMSSFRSSWSNNVLQGIFYGAMSSWLAVTEEVRAVGNTTFLVVCMIQHLNIRLMMPKFFEYLIVTPKNHYWHHSKEKKFPYGQNFGFILTVWDHLFKTYYNPPHFNTEIGLSEKFEYTSALSKLVYPIDKWIKKIFK